MACDDILTGGGSFADYYTCKGQGSEQAYDAYYAAYGDSSVWQSVSIGTLSNIASTRMGGSADFITTDESIRRITDKEQNNLLFLIVGGILAYNILL